MHNGPGTTEYLRISGIQYPMVIDSKYGHTKYLNVDTDTFKFHQVSNYVHYAFDRTYIIWHEGKKQT